MHVLIPALHRPLKPTGVCRHAANLAQCLADTDEVSQVTLLIGAWQKAYFETSFNFTSPKIKLYPIDIQNSSISRNRWFLLGLPGLANALQPDMIHMSFPFPFLRPLFRAPVVSTIHDLYPYECPENFGYPQVWFNRLFLRQCVSNSDGLICVSQCTLAALERYFPQAKHSIVTRVIYNIVNFANITSQQPEQFTQTVSSPFLLTVAQHRKNKNLDLLIQAYSILLQETRIPAQTQLLLVGSPGPETDALQALIRSLDLEQQVRFFAGLSDGELRWLYEHAALFVIPSATEGFCLPLVEALTLSCPAVCSDIPIFREIGAQRCRYFPLDPAAQHHLVEAIATELAHGSQRTHNQTADSRFSSREVADQLLHFYQSLKKH